MAKFFTRRLGKFPVEIVEISAFWVEAIEPEYLEQNFSLFSKQRIETAQWKLGSSEPCKYFNCKQNGFVQNRLLA